MNQLTENSLIQCLEVLENLPETVYRDCDLLVAICDRNGFAWCESMLESLCKDVSQAEKKICFKKKMGFFF